jgi:hypothetical protein
MLWRRWLPRQAEDEPPSVGVIGTDVSGSTDWQGMDRLPDGDCALRHGRMRWTTLYRSANAQPLLMSLGQEYRGGGWSAVDGQPQ